MCLHTKAWRTLELCAYQNFTGDYWRKQVTAVCCVVFRVQMARVTKISKNDTRTLVFPEELTPTVTSEILLSTKLLCALLSIFQSYAKDTGSTLDARN